MSRDRDETLPTSILRQAQANDGLAWQRLVHLYEPLLTMWARRGGVPADDCADHISLGGTIAGRLPARATRRQPRGVHACHPAAARRGLLSQMPGPRGGRPAVVRLPSIGFTSPLNDVNLRRLYGDFDANGTVDGADVLQFGNAFSSNSIAFDFDFIGTLDGADLLQLGNRFGVTL
jgi:hypothetical protein